MIDDEEFEEWVGSADEEYRAVKTVGDLSKYVAGQLDSMTGMENFTEGSRNFGKALSALLEEHLSAESSLATHERLTLLFMHAQLVSAVDTIRARHVREGN